MICFKCMDKLGTPRENGFHTSTVCKCDYCHIKEVKCLPDRHLNFNKELMTFNHRLQAAQIRKVKCKDGWLLEYKGKFIPRPKNVGNLVEVAKEEFGLDI